MKKIIIWIITIFLLTSCYSNPEDTKRIAELEKVISKIETSFQWTYSVGENIEKWRIWTLYIHKSNTNNYYYQIDVNKWAPSYNSWVHQWKIFINWKNWTNSDFSCFIDFNFWKEYIDIKNTFENNCWFWWWVIINWVYDKINKDNPEFYINMIWKKQYFKNFY